MSTENKLFLFKGKWMLSLIVASASHYLSEMSLWIIKMSSLLILFWSFVPFPNQESRSRLASLIDWSRQWWRCLRKSKKIFALIVNVENDDGVHLFRFVVPHRGLFVKFSLIYTQNIVRRRRRHKNFKWHCLHSELNWSFLEASTDKGQHKKDISFRLLILHLGIVKCMLK